MQRAVKAWLRQESGGTIRRNNPWNLHQGTACGSQPGTFCTRTVLPGQLGVQNVSSGDKNVAVFKDLRSGVEANAANLSRVRGAGYEAVLAEARAGSPEGFLDALARSKWSAGRYKSNPGAAPGGANNKLIAIYKGTTVGKTKGADTGDFDVGDQPLQLPNIEVPVLSPAVRALEFVADPGNWVRILAVAGGGVLIVVGGWRVLQAT
jgi:hypothetical protein